MTASPAPATRRSFGARMGRIALWLAGFLVLVAVVGFFIAPPVIRAQAEKILTRELGRTTTLDEVKVNPFAPSVTVRGFNVREADGTQPFLTFDELYVRASYTSLFRLAPVVDQVRLAKPHVRVVRVGAERFNFSDIQERLAARPKDDSPPSDEPARFAVYNIEVLDGNIEVDDRVVSRKLAVADIDVGVPFISSLPSQREVFVEPRFSATLNGAPLKAQAKSKPFTDTRESTLNFDLADLDVVPFVAYSPTKLPADIKSAKLDLDLDVTFAQPPGKPPTVVLAGRTNLKTVAVDLPAGGPLLRLESLATELAAIEPLANRFEITKVRITSPEFWVKRDKDGKFLLGALFVAPEPARGAGEAKSAPPAKPLTYRLDELLVEGGLLHGVDARGSRPIELEYRDIRAAVRNVSSAPGAKLTFELSSVTDLKETVAVDGEAVLDPIDVSGKARLGKVSLPRVWPLAEPFLAAELTSGRLDAGTRFRYFGKDGAPYLTLDGIEASLADVTLRQPRAKQEFFKLASFELRDGAFDLVQRRLSLGDVSSKGMRLLAVREKDGRIDLERLLPRSQAETAAAPDASSEPPFLIEVKKAVIDGYAIRVEDLTRAEPFTWSLEPLQATIEGFSTAPAARANATVKATVNRKGTVVASGPFGINPVSARLKVDARTLDIAPVQRFIDDQLNAAITSGLVSTQGNLRVDMPPGKPLRAGFSGDLTVADFASVDKASRQDLLKWKSLFVGGIDFELEPLKVNVNEVALADFYSRLIVNPDGTLNLQKVLAQPGDAGVSTTAASGAPATPPKPVAALTDDLAPKAVASGASGPTTATLPPAGKPAGGLPENIRIGRITLQGGNVDFSDFFIKPNYSANLTGIGGSVTEITPQKAGDLELRGKVDNTAPVEITGRLNPLATDLFLDIKASAKDIELPPLSPYAIKYAGYGIQKGKLSVNLKYFIENRKLAAENNVYLDQLTFGEKVESPTATKLPVLLAVALLKDRNGVIDIDLPVSGSLDDPQFSVGGIIVRVIVNLLTKVITAPFSALASAFGGKEELSFVSYGPGDARLDADAKKRLDTLGKALVDRPTLRLEVAGYAAPEADREGLKRAYIDSRVKAEKMKRLARESKPAATTDEVAVTKEEYPALLKAAYGEEKFPKPRNAIGLTKDLPVAEMENLMLTNATVSDEDLRLLANRRAQAAKDYLVDTAKVPAERVFLVAPVVTADAPKDKGAPTRANFSLK
jgi:hypothetical protein